MRTTKAVSLLVSFFLVLTIIPGCSSKEKSSSGITEKPANTVNIIGNSNGNLVNGGRFALQGNWVYYVPLNGGLYKMKTDGTAKTRLLKTTIFPSSINVVGDWIYYINYNNVTVEKIRTDGTQHTKLNIQTDYINVVGDWIYYLNQANVGLYKMKTDGTAITILNSRVSGNVINVEGDRVYYLDGLDSALVKMKTDGTEKTKVVPSASDFGDRFIVEGEWIYYLNHNDEFKPYKIKTDGTKETKLSNDPAGNLNVSGDWVYYATRDGMNFPMLGKICKIKTDGTNKTKLGRGSFDFTSVLGDWLYFSKYTIAPPKLYKMKTDGTGSTVIDQN